MANVVEDSLRNNMNSLKRSFTVLLCALALMPAVHAREMSYYDIYEWNAWGLGDEQVVAKFSYESTDELGRPILLSALMMWPHNTVIDNVVLYSPYTHCSDAECATNAKGLDSFEKLASTYSSNWLIIPDGEGFGMTKDRLQIYLNHEVWAKQMVDCLDAAMQLQIILKTEPTSINLNEDKWKLVLAGTSQGAGTAMATMRYMEEHKLADKYHLDFATVCCGPYNPALTMKTYFTEWYKLSYPCVIPMVIKSMIASYPQIMSGIREEDFYTDTYLGIKYTIDNLLAGKKTDADGINDVFVRNMAHDSNNAVYITEILRPDVLDLSSYAVTKLMECLERNNVLSGWTPEHRMIVYYNKYDEVVPFSNSNELMALHSNADKIGFEFNHSKIVKKVAGSFGKGVHEQSCGRWMFFSSWEDYTISDFQSMSEYWHRSTVGIEVQYKVGSYDELVTAIKESKNDPDTKAIISLSSDIILPSDFSGFNNDSSNPFVGTIDGNGHSIIWSGAQDNCALFGYLGESEAARACVENLVLRNFHSEKKASSVLASNANFTVFRNIYIDALSGNSINGDNSFVGTVAGHAEDCVFFMCTNAMHGSVGGSTSGGICGAASNSLFNRCSNTATVSGPVNLESGTAGGIVGLLQSGAIIDCANYGRVELSKRGYCGGIAGQLIHPTSSIRYSFSTGSAFHRISDSYKPIVGSVSTNDNLILQNNYFAANNDKVPETVGITAVPNSQISDGTLRDKLNDRRSVNSIWHQIENEDEYPLVDQRLNLLLSGVCGDKGDNLKWTFNRTSGILEINGNGRMKDIDFDIEHDDCVTDIPWYSFRDAIRTVVINGAVNITDNAFRDCTSLESVSLPEQEFISIGKNAFYNCTQLTAMVLPETVSEIGAAAFSHCTALESISLPKGITVLRDSLFQSCESLTAMDIPAGVTFIGEHTFENCKHLSGIEIPESVNTIGNAAFMGTAITGVRLLSVSSVPDSAFMNCKDLQQIVFNSAIETIGDYAFYSCSGVSSIVLPESLESIGQCAFASCYSVDEITVNCANVPVLGSDVFHLVANEGVLYVPEGMENDYRQWIGNDVLPEWWTIPDTFFFPVTITCGKNGSASIQIEKDGKEVMCTEAMVEKNDIILMDIQPDDGFLLKRILVNGRDFTRKMTSLNLKIREKTDIYVEFISRSENVEPSYGLYGTGARGNVYNEQSEKYAGLQEEENYAIEKNLIAPIVNTGISCAVDLIGNKTVGLVWSVLSCLETFMQSCEPVKSQSAPVRIESGPKSSVALFATGSSSEISYITDFQSKVPVAQKEIGAFTDILLEVFGVESWIRLTSMDELKAVLTAVEASEDDVLTADYLMPYKPQNITVEELELFVQRMNNTQAFAAGIPISSNNRVHALALKSCIEFIDEAEDEAVALGYESTEELWEKELAVVTKNAMEGATAVCATISLQLSQSMVMTRQAFRGTLTVFNGHTSVPMKNVRLHLNVFNERGQLATSREFQINAESLSGFEGEVRLDSGWELGAEETGSATVLFIPTKYAAPDEPVEYSFGGSLTYIDPFSGLEVTRSLYPVSLEVKPSPELNLTYFMQRDILGDNPLTTDVVEPSVPSEFALLIENVGNGDASNVRMTSSQPVIVENEKGLLVDFELLSSKVNGEDRTMALGGSVPAAFGDIPAHSTIFAQWMLKSSLLGHYTDYSVEATHISSYGNEALSLLGKVSIHELIHSFHLTGNNAGMTAWLVNDIADADDNPDIVYFSDARTEEVNVLGYENMSIEKQNGFTYMLSVNADNTGWCYGRIPDPTAGCARISEIKRQSDGAVVDLQNFWQTEYTLRDGNEPLKEYLIHFADDISASSENYLLTFEPLPDNILSVEAFLGAETDNVSGIHESPVETVVVKFNKPVDISTFSADDIRLTCRGIEIDLSSVSISTDDGISFNIDLSSVTSDDGYYVLMVQTSDITDSEGFRGQTGKSVDWTQFKDGLMVLKAIPVPAGGGAITDYNTVKKAARSKQANRTSAPAELELQISYNTQKSLYAEASEGFSFAGWFQNEQLLSTEPLYSSVYVDNTELIAKFDRRYLDLLLDYDAEAGSVDGNGSGKYLYGTEMSFIAVPLSGCRFFYWVVDNESMVYSETFELKLTKNTTIHPVFMKEYMSGKCGEVRWELRLLDSNQFPSYKLSIIGEGDMSDNAQPWDEYRDYITEVEICEGVRHVGANMCSGYCLNSVVMSRTVTSIGNGAFSGSTALADVCLKSIPDISKTAFEDMNGGIILNLVDAEKPYITIEPSETGKFNSVSYHRTVAVDKLGSIILPFVPAETEGLEFYELSDVKIEDNAEYGTLYFMTVGSLEAGKPYLFKNVSRDTDVELSARNVSVRVSTFDTYIDDWIMKGSYQSFTLDGKKRNLFYLSNNGFYHSTGTLNISPFRAYIEKEVPVSSIRSMVLLIVDGEVTRVEGVMEDDGQIEEVDSVYDIYGNRLENIRLGQVNIIRMKNGKTIKILL